MRSRNIEYLPGVDHLRAFASILIVVYHTVQFVFAKLTSGGPPLPGQRVPVSNPFEALIVEGHTAVSLFMVLSGFVFTFGVIGREIHTGSFLRNRLLRIYPLFIFLIAVGTAVHPRAVRLDSLGLTLLGLANLPGSLQLGYISAMFWTVALECQFYLLFPLLLSLANRYGPRILVLWIVLAVVFRGLGYALGAQMAPLTYTSLLGRIDAFLLGMLAAMVLRSGRVPERVWLLLLLPSLLGMVALLSVFHAAGGLGASAWWRIFWPTVEAQLAWCRAICPPSVP